MKKSLIAVSVLAATASIAQAQNVSLYGVMDGTVASVKSGSFSNTVLVSGGHSTSRFGLRGSEDLGGGLKANFNLEAGMAIDTGMAGGPSGATSATTGTNQLFNRGAFVGVEGGMGALNVGKISTHANAWLGTYSPGAGNYNWVSFRSAATPTLTGWRDNTLEYTTPRMAGVQARLLYTFGNTAAASTGSEGTTAANKKFGQGTEVGVNYTAGPLNVGYFSAKLNTTASATAKEEATGLGASYNFGVARAGATYQQYDPDTTATNDKIKSYSAAIAVPVTASLSLSGFYGNATQEATTDRKTNLTSIGADYALSKRTTAHAFYVKVKNNNGGAAGVGLSGLGAANGSPLPAIAVGDDPNALGIGIRHTF